MTNQFHSQLTEQAELQKPSSTSESGEDQAKAIGDPEALENSRASRRKSASKREIMEELNRERFPWEE